MKFLQFQSYQSKKSLKVVNNTLNKTPTHLTDTYDRLDKFLLSGNVWFLE